MVYIDRSRDRRRRCVRDELRDRMRAGRVLRESHCRYQLAREAFIVDKAAQS